MRYMKIGPIIFEIELLDNSNHDESRLDIVDPIYALYSTDSFRILNYKHIANNNISKEDFDKVIFYLYAPKIKFTDDVAANIIDIIKQYYNVNIIDDLINREVCRDFTYYFKSYERAFNYHFIFEKQYLLFKEGYSGIYKNWDMIGNLVIEYYHVNGSKEGNVRIGQNFNIFCSDMNTSGSMSSENIDLLYHHHYDYD